jgi:hypothetical protein
LPACGRFRERQPREHRLLAAKSGRSEQLRCNVRSIPALLRRSGFLRDDPMFVAVIVGHARTAQSGA